jgi:hypothetical protein
MSWITAARRAVGLTAAIAFLAAFTPGCAKKITTVNAAYTTPEGVFTSKARLYLAEDAPIGLAIYWDRTGNGPSPDDSLLEIDPTYLDGPGAIHATILDQTVASAYQSFRREANGGLRQLQDYPLLPKRRWLDTHWELYNFTDLAPSSYAPPTYIGRGIVSGVVTRTSPLTNFAQLVGPGITPIFLDFQIFLDHESLPDSVFTPQDSIFGIHWTEVPNAAGYWIQVYSFTGDAFEKIRSAAPAPIYANKSRDNLIVFVPAPADSYRINFSPGEILTYTPLILGHQYLARISAVDATGGLIGYSYGDSDQIIGFPPADSLFASKFTRFPLGAYRVNPKHPTSIPRLTLRH